MKKRDFETYQKRFRDFEILPKFSETHVFQGTIHQPLCCNALNSVVWQIPIIYYNMISPTCKKVKWIIDHIQSKIILMPYEHCSEYM